MNTKRYALLIIALMSGSLAWAQLEIRPYAGANFSNVGKTPDNTQVKAKVGTQIGVGLIFGDHLYLNPSIAYFGRKTEFSNTGQEDLSFDQTINGVIIPVLVGYRLMDPDDDPAVNLRVFAGPSFMYLSKTKYDDPDINEDIDWNSSQWGAQVGAGLDISIFFVDFAYEFGLTNANEGIRGENSVFDNFNEVKQNTFIVNAGIRLQLAR